MAKKESDEKLEFESAVGLKRSLGSVIISIFKFILSIILLPLVIGLTISFSKQLTNQQSYIINNFVLAMLTYLILHIFIFPPRGLFSFGQRIIGNLFGFFVPLRQWLYRFLPFYVTLFFVLYLIFKTILGYENIIGYSIFLISFSATMHLILTASDLKDESAGVIKGEYFFSLFLVYLFEIIFLACFFSVMLDNFSFINFIKEGFRFFVNAIITVWRQLFVLK